MISVVLSLLLLCTGYLLSTYLVRKAALVERAAYTLLFSLSAVPLVVIILCLTLKVYASAGLVAGVSALFLLLLSRHGISHLRDLPGLSVRWDSVLVLMTAAAVATGAWVYHSNAEVFWSLHSYLLTDKASCFSMQLYRLVEGLNPAADPGRVREMYNIISTPGNALFPVGVVPIFGVHTFHALYVLFSVNLYLFIYLLVHQLTGKRAAALAAALFAVANPYWLSVEVLDRNAIALSVSAALIHALFFHRQRLLLHGLLLGLVAGTGLRFLPLTFGISVLVCHLHNRTRPLGYLKLAGAAAGVFIFNIPHLFHHGFHSLGEERPFWSLLFSSVTELTRTPFVPYPNLIYYPLTTLSHLGALACALVLFGGLKLLARDRVRALALLLMLPVPYLALAAQPDWIQVDKARIFISILLPLLVFAGVGLASLLAMARPVRDLGVLAACLAGVLLLGLGLGKVTGTPDSGTYKRRPMYQTEAEPYIRHYRAHFAPVGLLPGYGRLFRKAEVSRKRLEEQVIAHTLFRDSPNPRISDNKWIQRWLAPKSLTSPPGAKLAAPYVNLRIDMERLVTGGQDAVSIPAAPGDLFVNLENKADLLDIYYRSMKVTWQPQPLPVAVMTGKPESETLGELYIDLNVFISLGQDEDGFEQVNLISSWITPARRPHGRRTGMIALPHRGTSTAVTLRVPRAQRVVIRNWIVDGVMGVPHRVDAWEITMTGRDGPRVTFHPHEPESYF